MVEYIIRYFASELPTIPVMRKKKQDTRAEDVDALRAEVTRLLKELRHERMKAEALDTMIDIAETTLNIPVRKNWFQTVRALHARNSVAHTVAELCGVFGKSKQAYYKNEWDSDLRRLSQEEFASQFIRQVREKDPGIGGVKIWIMYCNEFCGWDRIGRDRFLEFFEVTIPKKY